MTRDILRAGLGVLLGVLAACDKETESSRTPEPVPVLSLEDLEAGDAGGGVEDRSPRSESSRTVAGPRARDRDPEEEKRKMARSRATSDRAAKLLAARRLGDAVAMAREALKMHEQNVAAMLVLAEVFYLQGKFELTQSVTNSALAVDEKIRTPQDTSGAYNLKGFAYVGMGKPNLATQSFRAAAEADDHNAAAWNNLGTRYLQSGDVKTAMSCFDYALELEPNFAKAHLNRGAGLRAQGRWADAEQEFRRALTLRKDYPEAYFNLGILYLDADPFPGLQTKQRLEKAISYLNRYKQAGRGPQQLAQPARRRSAADPETEVVSSVRADDYIRVAQKGIDRELRRDEREAKRQGPGPTTPTAPASDERPVAATPTQTPSRAGSPARPQRAASEGAPPARPDGSPRPAPQSPSSRRASPKRPVTQSPTRPQRPQQPQRPGSP